VARAAAIGDAFAMPFALGLDHGTSSVRALLVDTADGREVATATSAYPTGDGGVVTDPHNPDVARQHPADWHRGAVAAVRDVLAQARALRGFEPRQIAGIGVDTTGSTPLPVDRTLRPLALLPEFATDPGAMAWLWKDHSSHAEAAEITAKARTLRLPYLAKCGGTYSSEWFWSKLLHCERQHPRVAAAAHAWLEFCDYIPAWLCGIADPAAAPRSICAAGHKAMYHPQWQGLPSRDFLAALAPGLVRARETFRAPALAVDHRAGTLCEPVAQQLGLPAGIPVAVGALDAHLGAVGSGIGPGTLVKILGTSTCDCMVAPMNRPLPDVPGLCGIAPETILPGMYGLEAGQSAVGDIFQWFVQKIALHGSGEAMHEQSMHEQLAAAAARLEPGSSGLLALDWHNGNRCVLVDPRLTGLVLGLTLQTTTPELYRAWIEATAFGARAILDRLHEHGVATERIVTCGGVAEKSPLLMQIYADVCERPLASARSAQACALGAACCGAVVGGAHADVPAAQRAMTGVKAQVYQPDPRAAAVYRRLYALYRQVHDAFGLQGERDLSGVMKELLAIRDQARAQ
jgi:L-ribulokinase